MEQWTTRIDPKIRYYYYIFQTLFWCFLIVFTEWSPRWFLITLHVADSTPGLRIEMKMSSASTSTFFHQYYFWSYWYADSNSEYTIFYTVEFCLYFTRIINESNETWKSKDERSGEPITRSIRTKRRHHFIPIVIFKYLPWFVVCVFLPQLYILSLLPPSSSLLCAAPQWLTRRTVFILFLHHPIISSSITTGTLITTCAMQSVLNSGCAGTSK